MVYKFKSLRNTNICTTVPNNKEHPIPKNCTPTKGFQIVFSSRPMQNNFLIMNFSVISFFSENVRI